LGSNIAGQARLFGFDVSANLKIKDSGLSGSLDIKEPLTFPGFELTAANDHTCGPHFELESEGPKFLDLDLRMAVFGVDASAGVKLTDKGFTVDTRLRFKGNNIKVSCWFSPPIENPSVGITINETFSSPIVIQPGGYRVKIETLKVTMSKVGFHYSVTGTKPGFPKRKGFSLPGTVKFEKMGHDLNKLLNAIMKDAGKKVR